MVEKTGLLYEGKAKKVYETDDPNLLFLEFKDEATAFNGVKKGTIANKGIINAAITERLLRVLESAGVPTHLVARAGDRSLIVRRLDMYPVEIVVRNRVAGSLEKRYGLKRGTKLPRPVIEYYLKNDELHDPMLNRQHVVVLGYMPERALAKVEELALAVNRKLSAFMKKKGLELVDFKLEFGVQNRRIYLGDEITPDTCRIWDATTGEVMDKDRFRFDLGEVEQHYAILARRLEA